LSSQSPGVTIRSVFTPYPVVDPLQAVIPCSSTSLLSLREIELHPGLKSWWEQAEAVWEANRTSDRLTLMEQLDYQSKLSRQLPIAPFRVRRECTFPPPRCAVRAIMRKSHYWAAFHEEEEADFLRTNSSDGCPDHMPCPPDQAPASMVI
jgi:hypothetical protein